MVWDQESLNGGDVFRGLPAQEPSSPRPAADPGDQDMKGTRGSLIKWVQLITQEEDIGQTGRKNVV